MIESLLTIQRRVPMSENYPQCICLRCGHTWNPTTPLKPLRCPKCTNAYWNTPPIRTAWTPEEKEMALKGEIPTGRTRGATAATRYRERKKN